MNLSSNISFSEKGRDGKDRRASLGSARPAERRQTDGGLTMSKYARKQMGTSVVPWTTGVPLNEDEAKKEFASIVVDIPRWRLAKAAKCGKDAAKRWQEGSRLPAWLTALNMAQPGEQGIPAVRNYVLMKLGIDPAMISAAEHMRFRTPQMMEAAVAAVYQVMHQPGPDGDAVRAALAKMGSGK